MVKLAEKRFFACCGAGSSGKTVVIAPLTKRLEGCGFKVAYLQSVVRGFYAQKGVKDQAAFFELPVMDRREFQFELLDYYISSAVEFIDNNKDAIILSDRSPFDHLAYVIDSTHDLTLAEYHELYGKACEFSAKYIGGLMYFPWPAHFSKDKDDDPFRVAHPHQNLKIDGMMRAQSYKASREVPFYYTDVVAVGIDSADHDTIENRVNICEHFIRSYATQEPLAGYGAAIAYRTQPGFETTDFSHIYGEPNPASFKGK